MIDPMVPIFELVFSRQMELIDRWQGSPFAPLRVVSPGTKGKIGQRMIATWAQRAGLLVNNHPRGSEADLIIENSRVEVKLSLLWEQGLYSFMQIRDQQYDAITLLGISPERAHIWVAPKAEVWDRAVGQHTGNGASDTRWLQFAASAPPQWLAKYGGDHDVALKSLREVIV